MLAAGSARRSALGQLQPALAAGSCRGRLQRCVPECCGSPALPGRCVRGSGSGHPLCAQGCRAEEAEQKPDTSVGQQLRGHVGVCGKTPSTPSLRPASLLVPSSLTDPNEERALRIWQRLFDSKSTFKMLSCIWQPLSVCVSGTIAYDTRVCLHCPCGRRCQMQILLETQTTFINFLLQCL